MYSIKQISMMIPGDSVEGFFVLKSASPRTTNTGKPFLNASLSDASGTIEAKIWDYSGPIGQHEEGKVVKIRAYVEEFKGRPQLRIERIRLAADTDNYSLSDLVSSAPIDSMREMEFIHNIVASIADEEYRAVCERMLDRHVTAFARIPAAKSIHHSFISGLLMHTGSMLRIADFLATDIYPDAVDRSLLLAGTLLHDFAKDREFAFSELGEVTDMTVAGRLLGHLVIGAEEIGSVGHELGISPEKIMLLQHMILSHHGQPEFGAAVIPCTAEAELLSYIDLMDSRMEIYAEQFETLPKGSFSGRVYALDKRIYNHE